MPDKKALVTGGAGFIGSHVAEALQREGYHITVVDNLSSGSEHNVPDGAELVVCDVRSEQARELVAGGGFELVDHHAAQMDVRVSVADPMLDADINLMGLLNLLEGARAGGVKKFLFASSGGVVYGESDNLPHTETAPKLPVSPYGVSKLGSEYYLAMYSLLYGLKVVSLRYANVYGPRQSPHGEAGVVAIFGSRITRDQTLTIFGDGDQTRDYVFVKDVARANVAASKFEGVCTSIDDVAFNIGTATETSVKQLAQAMLEASGRTVSIEHAPARTGELFRSCVDNSRAKKLIDWEPQVDLIEGLGETYRWIAGTVK